MAPRIRISKSAIRILSQHQFPLEPYTKREYAERQIVLGALERNQGRVTKTAEELGLADHASLLKIMRRLGIEREK